MTNNVKNTFIPITIRYPILGHRVSNYLYVNVCLRWKMMYKSLVSCSDKTADKEQYGANLTELSHLLSLACPKQLAPIIRDFSVKFFYRAQGGARARSVTSPALHMFRVYRRAQGNQLTFGI